MTTEVLTILAGIALVLGLSEVVVRNVIAVAHRYRLTGGFVGLTILSVGTSIPEIMTQVVASVTILREPGSMDTLSALVVGANIGSDIFQQNFVLPFAGLVGTIVVVRTELHEQMGALTAASILVWIFSLGGLITRLEGALLVVSYIAYLLFLASRSHLAEHLSEASGVPQTDRMWVRVSLIVLCFLLIAVVSERVVLAAGLLVDRIPLSASFFGVLFLGMATALPELSAALVAISKGEQGISAGVLIGSNVTNPLLGIGLGAAISQYSVPHVVTLYDLPVKILTALILYIFLLRQENLTRREAGALIAMFVFYLYARHLFFPEDVIP